jgi:hypothetical protein
MIQKGEVSPEAAGKKLAKPCPCGIFNVPRTVEVLKKRLLSQMCAGKLPCKLSSRKLRFESA